MACQIDSKALYGEEDDGSLLGLYTLMHVSTSPLTERRRSAYMRDAYICPFKGEALERRIF